LDITQQATAGGLQLTAMEWMTARVIFVTEKETENENNNFVLSGARTIEYYRYCTVSQRVATSTVDFHNFWLTYRAGNLQSENV